MSAAGVFNPYKKRQHAKSDDEDEFGGQKRQNLCSSPHHDTLPSAQASSRDYMNDGEARISTELSSARNDEEEDDDDASNFELDFALCPEVGAVTSKLSRLNIQEEEVEEVGDEQQVKAIHHAQSGDNIFLTGKGGCL